MKNFKLSLFLTIFMSMIGNTVWATSAKVYCVNSTSSSDTYDYIYINDRKVVVSKSGYNFSSNKTQALEGDVIFPDTLIYQTYPYTGKIYSSSMSFTVNGSEKFQNVTSITFGKVVDKVSIASACPLVTTLNIPNHVKELYVTDMLNLKKIEIEERADTLKMNIIGFDNKNKKDVLPKLNTLLINSENVPANGAKADYAISWENPPHFSIIVPFKSIDKYREAWPNINTRIFPLMESADIVFYDQATLQDYLVETEKYDMDTMTSVVFYNGKDDYLTDKWLKTGMNPNCLFYVYPDSTMSGNNVVRLSDMTADNIILQDGRPFRCPVSFTAKKATYTYTPSVWADGKNGWETVCLPYEVRNFRASTRGALSPILLGTDGNFWLREFIGASSDELYFTSTYDGVMKAYTPYIVAFPGSKMGKNNIEGQNVSFIGKDVVVGADQPAIVQRNDFIFKGGFDIDADEGTGWILNSNGNGFDQTDIVGNNPFHAYFKTENDETAAGAKSLSISTELVEEEGTLVNTVKVEEDMLDVVADEGAVIIKAQGNTIVNIYGANGALLRCVHVNAGENRVEGLANGLYIINKQKILIR